MIDNLIQRRYFPWLLFFVALGMFSINIWGINIYFLDEAKNTECAREMLEQKDFFKPTFNYNLRKDKPPLHYFFMMLSFSVFGVSAFAARFFSAVFGALTIWITFFYTGKFLNRKAAFFTSLVMLASIHLNIQFHFAVPDPYLIFFFLWTLFLFYSAVTTGKKRDVWLMYISMGLGVLSKGPVAIVLPGLIFFLFLLLSWKLNRTTIKILRPFTGIAIVLAITLPWFILNGTETNWEWTKGFFLTHNLNRYTSKMEGHGGIFLLTFLYVFIGMLPFSVFLPRAIAQAWRKRKDSFLLFNLVAAFTIIVFFSASQTKLPNYTVPAYPFLAILIAWYIFNPVTNSKKLLPWMAGLLIFTLALPIGGFIALKEIPYLAAAAHVSWWFLILPAGTLLAFLTLAKGKIKKSVCLLGFTFMLGAILFTGVMFPAFDKLNPVIKSASMVEGRAVAYYKKFNSAYSFFIQKKIPRLDESQIEEFFRKNPDGVLISIRKHIDGVDLPEGYEIIYSGKDLFEKPVTVLIGKKEWP